MKNGLKENRNTRVQNRIYRKKGYVCKNPQSMNSIFTWFKSTVIDKFLLLFGFIKKKSHLIK